MKKKSKKQNKQQATEQQATESRNQKYKYWVILIVKQVEETGELKDEAKEAYKEFVSHFPHAKSVLDSLIQEVRQFSVYDDEPATVNFDYSAYLLQIQNLVG